MRTLFKTILLGLLIAQTASGAAIQGQNAASNLYGKSFLQVPSNQATDLGANKALIETGNKNLLINASFEHKVFDTNWTLLGSATDAVETSTIIDGVKAAKINITASGDGIANSVTPAVNTLNQQMEAGCKVNTSMTNIQLCATAGGVEQSCQPVPATGSYQAVSANFQGPVNGTAVGVKIKSTSAGTGVVYADDCFVGPARNLSQVSQAQAFGSLTVTNCTPGAWGWTGTSFVDTATSPTGCTPTVTGQITYPSGNLPQFTIPSGPAGDYQIVFTGLFENSPTAAGQVAQLQITDGTISSDGKCGAEASSASAMAIGTCSFHLTYSSAISNKVIKFQAKNSSGTASLYASSSYPLHVDVKYFPSQSQTALTSANNVASWSGYHTAASSFTQTSSATPYVYGDFTGGGASVALTTRTSRNITCANGSTTTPAITCSLPKAGIYELCYKTAMYDATSSTHIGTRVVDGSGTVIAVDPTTYAAGGSFYAQGNCGQYNATAAGSTTFKIQGMANIASHSLGLGNSSADMVEWTIKALDSMGGPVILSAPSSSGNFMTGGDGESGANICTPYADAAGVAPVTGSGGAPTVSCALSSTSPISGSQSYVLTKPASNVQGQGWSFPFTVDQSAQAKMLQVSFDYQVDSNYTVGSDTSTPDIVAYVYGPTDGTPQLTQLTPYKALGGSGTLKFQGNLQTAASGKAYRLILHEPNTGTLASSIKVDNISVSPVLRQFGTPVTDWQSYTPTDTLGLGTISSPNIIWRRVGDSMEISATFVTGTTNGSNVQFSIPSGYSIDASKIQATNNTLVGVWGRGAAASGYVVIANPTDLTHIRLGSNAGQLQSQTGAALGSSEQQSIFARLPIQGWTSSTQMSDQSGDNRIVSFTAQANTNQTVGTGVNLHFPDNISDSHGAWNGTDTYKIPVPGDYYITGSVTANTPSSGDLYLYKNGSSVTHLTSWVSTSNCYNGGALVRGLKAGDLLTFQHSVTTATFVANGGLCNNVGIFRLSGNQQIQASESVSASYYISTSTSPATATPINFDAKIYDSHNAVTTGSGTWKFTAPSAGKYRVTSFINASSAVSGFLAIYKNGSLYKSIGYTGNWGSTLNGSGTVPMNAGDYLDVRPAGASGTPTINGNPLTNPGVSIVDIERVAN